MERGTKRGTELLITRTGVVFFPHSDGSDTASEYGKMPTSAEKGEDIDLNGFGVQVWGEKE